MYTRPAPSWQNHWGSRMATAMIAMTSLADTSTSAIPASSRRYQNENGNCSGATCCQTNALGKRSSLLSRFNGQRDRRNQCSHRHAFASAHHSALKIADGPTIVARSRDVTNQESRTKRIHVNHACPHGQSGDAVPIHARRKTMTTKPTTNGITASAGRQRVANQKRREENRTFNSRR